MLPFNQVGDKCHYVTQWTGAKYKNMLTISLQKHATVYKWDSDHFMQFKSVTHHRLPASAQYHSKAKPKYQ